MPGRGVQTRDRHASPPPPAAPSWGHEGQDSRAEAGPGAAAPPRVPLERVIVRGAPVPGTDVMEPEDAEPGRCGDGAQQVVLLRLVSATLGT